jgi:hypothetical protein
MNKNIFALLFFICLFSIEQMQAQEQEQVNPNVKEIIVVFKTHFDIGYTDLSESVLQRYSSSMIKGALQDLDESKNLPKDKQFVWTLAGWPMKEILERTDPVTKTKVEEAIKQGRFALHALPITFETESSDMEDLVRGMIFSSTLSRKYGLPIPRDAKITDVPSHSWILPTILHNAGVDILHIGCNSASQSPRVPLIFWWEGPDGSRLLTMYWGKYYGTSLVPTADWKYKSWLAIIMTNDNSGAPSPEEVTKVLNETHRLAPNANIKIGRISDFYDVIMKENPQLEVVRGDMPDTWIHGFMSMPKEEKIAKAVQKDNYTLEALNTLCKTWIGYAPDIKATIAKSSENSLLFSEHTFGMAMSHGQSGYWCYGDAFKKLRAQGVYKTIEDSWKEKSDYIYQAEKKIIPTLSKQLHDLASAINIKGDKILVYNPLPWERGGLVKIQFSSKWNPIKALKDVETNEIIPVSNSGNMFSFISGKIPSMGYKTYQAVMDEPAMKIEAAVTSTKTLAINTSTSTLENEFFKLQIDTLKGRISSLVDKRSGRELVNINEDTIGFNQYFYERFSKKMVDSYAKTYIKGGWDWAFDELGRPNLTNDPYKAVHGAKCSISFEKNINSVSATLLFTPDGNMPHSYTQIITLYSGLPYVELRWAIDSKQAEPWPEAGWISFPFNIKDPQFKLIRTGGIVNPETDFVKNTNFDYFFLNSGLAILDKNGQGIGLSSPDAPGVSLDRPGGWKFTPEFFQTKPNLFVNLYNNQWSTNFTEWIEGSWNVRMLLWSIDKYDPEQSLVTPDQEAKVPLIGVLSDAENGKLSQTASGVKLSKKGVLVTAYGPNIDGAGTILRLWEQTGNNGEVVITLPEKSNYKQAVLCNLRGVSTRIQIPIQNNTLKVNLKANAPLSIILR